MSTSRPMPRLFLIRHGETEWSLNGRHTGLSDIPLTARGEQRISSISSSVVGDEKLLNPASLCHILVSPRQRAQKTFQLLFGSLPQIPSYEITPDVREWDYGDYEGLVASEIHKRDANWEIFRDGCPGGESAEDMCKRVDSVIGKVKEIHRQYLYEGIGRRDVMIVAHGHFSRCLVARWLAGPLKLGMHINVEPAGIAILSYKHRNLDEAALDGLNLYAY